MQAEAAKQIEALKEGLARELRKQKASWRGLTPHFGRMQLATCWPGARPSLTEQTKRADLQVPHHKCLPLSPSPNHFTGTHGLLQEVYVASERAKREAWMAEQTRSIKETTIKGLEPEIQVRGCGYVWLSG